MPIFKEERILDLPVTQQDMPEPALGSPQQARVPTPPPISAPSINLGISSNDKSRMGLSGEELSRLARMPKTTYEGPNLIPLGEVVANKRYNTYVRGLDLENIYGLQQSWYDQLGNSAVKFAGTMVGTFAQQFASIPNTVRAIKTGASQGVGEGFAELSGRPDGYEASIDNWLKNLEDDFPNYFTRWEKAHPFLSAITPSGAANFWGDKIIKNLGFMAGALAGAAVQDAAIGLITGGVGEVPLIASQIGKASLYLNKILSGTNKVDKVFDIGRAVGASTESILSAKKLAEISAGISNLDKFRYATALYGASRTEAAVEARESYRTIKEDLIKEHVRTTGEEPDGKSLEEIESYATNAMNTRFGINLALLTVSNAVQFGNVFKSFTSSTKKIAQPFVREIDNAGKVALKAGSIDTFEKVLPKTFSGKVWESVKPKLDDIFSEGIFEEGGQYAAERGVTDYYTRKYKNKENWDSLEETVSSTVNGLKDQFGTSEGIENMVIGALTAVITGAGKTYVDKKRGVPTSDDRLQRSINILNNQGLTGILSNQYASTMDAMGIAKEMETALADGNIFRYKNLKSDMFFNMVTSRIPSDMHDVTIEQLKMLKDLDKEQFESLFGMDFNASTKKTVGAYVDNLILSANEIKNSVDSLNYTFKNPFQFVPDATTAEQSMMNDKYIKFENWKKDLANFSFHSKELDARKESIGKSLFEINPILSTETLERISNVDSLKELSKEYEEKAIQLQSSISPSTPIAIARDIRSQIRTLRSFSEKINLELSKDTKDLKWFADLLNFETNNQDEKAPSVINLEKATELFVYGVDLNKMTTIKKGMAKQFEYLSSEKGFNEYFKEAEKPPVEEKKKEEGTPPSAPVYEFVNKAGEKEAVEEEREYELPSSGKASIKKLAENRYEITSPDGSVTFYSSEEEAKVALDEINEKLRGLESVRVLAVNPDGTIKIEDANGDVYNISLDKLKGYEKIKTEQEALEKFKDDIEEQQNEIDLNNTGDVPSDPYNETDYKGNPEDKRKSWQWLFWSTASASEDKDADSKKPHAQRSIAFHNNVKKFENKNSMRVMLVTPKQEAALGLTGLHKLSTGEDVKKDASGNVIIEDTDTALIAAVYVEQQGADYYFVDKDGKRIGKVGDPVDLNQVVFSTMPDTSLYWKEGGKNAERFRIDQKKEAEEMSQRWAIKRKEIFELSSDKPEIYSFKVSNGIPTVNSMRDRNQVGSTLIEESKIKSQEGLIAVSTKGTLTHNGISYKIGVGRAMIQYEDVFVPAINNKFNKPQAEAIFEVLKALSEDIKKQSKGGQKIKFDPTYVKYLTNLLYWKKPVKESSKPNQMFIDSKMNLTIGNKKYDITKINDFKKEIVDSLTEAFHNINNKSLSSKEESGINKFYERFIEFYVEDGQLKEREWTNYQTYLLSAKYPDGSARNANDTPVTTFVAKPTDLAPYNFKQKYAILSPTEFPVLPIKASDKKTEPPPSASKETVVKAGKYNVGKTEFVENTFTDFPIKKDAVDGEYIGPIKFTAKLTEDGKSKIEIGTDDETSNEIKKITKVDTATGEETPMLIEIRKRLGSNFDESDFSYSVSLFVREYIRGTINNKLSESPVTPPVEEVKKEETVVPTGTAVAPIKIGDVEFIPDGKTVYTSTQATAAKDPIQFTITLSKKGDILVKVVSENQTTNTLTNIVNTPEKLTIIKNALEPELNKLSLEEREKITDLEKVEMFIAIKIYGALLEQKKKAGTEAPVSDIEALVITEENYNNWSNVRDKSDYQAFVDQVKFTLSMFDQVPDKSKITAEVVYEMLDNVKAFANKAVKDKVVPLIVAKYKTSVSDKKADIESKKQILLNKIYDATINELEDGTFELTDNQGGLIAEAKTREELEEKFTEYKKRDDEIRKELAALESTPSSTPSITPSEAPTVVVTPSVKEAPTPVKEEPKKKKGGKRHDDAGEYRLVEKKASKKEKISQEDIEIFKKWHAEVAANIPYEIAEKLFLLNDGRRAYGMFVNGVAKFYKGAIRGTEYHEIFEGIWKAFLTSEQRQEILDELKAKSGTFTDRETGKKIRWDEATDKQIKERIADDFAEYRLGKLPARSLLDKIVKLFKNIIEFFKSIVSKPSKVDQLFNDIEKGKFKNYIVPESAKSEIPEYSAVEGLTQTDTRMYVEDMTSLIFQQLFQTNKSLFDIQKITDKDLYDVILKKYQDAEKIDDTDSDLLSTKQFDDLFNKTKQFLRVFKIEFDDSLTGDINNSEADNRNYAPEPFATNWKKHSGYPIKLLLGTLIQTKPSGSVDANNIPTSKVEWSNVNGYQLLNFSKAFATVMDKLHNTSSVKKVVEKLVNLASLNTDYYRLLGRLKLNKAISITEGVMTMDFSGFENHDWRLFIQFYQTFTKQKPTALIQYVSGDMVYTSPANLFTAAEEVKRDWLSNIILLAKDKTSIVFFNSSSKKYVVNDVSKIPTSTPEEKIEFLKKLGINFPLSTYLRLSVKKEIGEKTEQSKFNDAVSSIQTYLVKDSELASISDESLKIDGAIKRLAELYVRVENPPHETTRPNIEGEQVNEFADNNHASVFENEMNEATTVEALIVKRPELNDVFSASSLVLKKGGLFYDEDGKQIKRIKISHIEGSKNIDAGKDTKVSRLNPGDAAMIQFNQNLNGDYYILIPADSSTEWMINLGNNISYEDVVNGKRAWGKINKIFQNYLNDEIELALSDRSYLKNTEVRAKELRFFKEILPEDMIEEINKIISNDDFSVSKKRTDIKEYVKNNISRVDESVKSFIESSNEDMLNDLVKYKKILRNENNTFSFKMLNSDFSKSAEVDNKNLTEKELNDIMMFRNINYIISNIELHKVLFGDPYQFKIKDNLLDLTKRIKSFLSPRRTTVDFAELNTFLNQKRNFAGDIELDSKELGYHTFSSNIHTVSLSDVDVIGTVYSKFDITTKETDGFSLMMDNTYRELKMKNGQWIDEKAEPWHQWQMAYTRNKLSKKGRYTYVNEKLKAQDAKMISKPAPKHMIEVLKTIATGNKSNKTYFDNVLDKFSQMPLYYSMVENTNLEKLYVKMWEENIGYAVYESGRKVGAESLHKMYDGQGNFNNDPFTNIIDIPWKILGVQVETTYEEFHDDLTQGSQTTKIVTIDLFDNGEGSEAATKEYKRYLKILSESHKNGAKELFEKLGINENFEVVDPVALSETLKHELLSRDASDNIEYALQLDENNQFRIPFESTNALKEIRDILFSLVNKAINSRKVHGGAYVQVPVTGFEKFGSSRSLILKKKDAKGKFIYEKISSATYDSYSPEEKKNVYLTDDTLKMPTVDDRYMEVLLPHWFREKLPKKYDTDEKILQYLNSTEEGKQLLRGVGFRIPTQALSSIAAIRVAGFLPQFAGHMVVVPSEITTMSGSDFDIDKMFIYLKSFYLDASENIRIVVYKDDEASTKEFYKNVYEETIQKKIDKITRFDEFRDTVIDLFSALEMFDEITFDNVQQLSDEMIKFYDTHSDLLNEMMEQASEERITPKEYILDQIKRLGDKKDLLTQKMMSDELKEKYVKKMYKHALENEYYDSLEKLLTLEENYERNISPVDDAGLKDVAKEIEDLTGEKGEKVNNRLLSASYMTKLRHAFVTAKRWVGIAAVNLTGHSMAQKSKLHLNPAKFNNLNKQEKAILGDGSVALPHNTVKIGNKTYVSLSGVFTNDGNRLYISSRLSGYTSTFVDVAKDPYIMKIIKSELAVGTFMFLERIGAGETIPFFMNQPIIRKYLEQLDESNMISLFNNNEIALIFSKFPTTESVLEETQLDVSISSLKKNMKDYRDGNTNDAFNAMQQQIFLEFLKYAKMAEYSFKLTQASNYDTTKFRNADSLFKKSVRTNMARDFNIFSSVDQLLDNSHLGEQAYYLDVATQAVAKHLQIDNKEIRENIINEILLPYAENIYLSDDKFSEIGLKVTTSLLDFIIQTRTGLNSEISELTSDNETSPVTLLAKLKENYPNDDLLLLLHPRQARVGGPWTIKLKGNEKSSGYDENYFIGRLREIRDNADEDTKELTTAFYKSLVKLSIIQGSYRSAMSIKNIIPAEDYAKEIGDVMRNIKYTPAMDVFKLGMFYRNQWKDDNIFKKVKLNYNRGIESFPDLSVLGIPVFSRSVILLSEKYHMKTVSSDYMKMDRFIVNEKRDTDEEDSVKDILTNREYSYREYKRMLALGETAPKEILGFEKLKYDDGSPVIKYDSDGNKTFIYRRINLYGDSGYVAEYYEDFKKSVIYNGTSPIENEANTDALIKHFTSKEVIKPNQEPITGTDMVVFTSEETEVPPFDITPTAPTAAAPVSGVEITKTNYTREDVRKNPNTAYVFTENTHSITAFPNTQGGGSAIIRPEPNAFAIVTKKKYDYNTKENVDYSDTSEDFAEFTEVNTRLINELKNSGKSKIVFPQGFATDKAKMPTRFAEWLQKALLDNFGLVTELNSTKTGLISKSVSSVSKQVSNEPKGEMVKEGVYVNQEGLTKEEQLELFDYLKPILEKQATRSNKGKNAPKMAGLELNWDYVSNRPTQKRVDVKGSLRPNNTYGWFKQSSNGLPLEKMSTRFKELMSKAVGIDVTDYDGSIINIYNDYSFIGNHPDIDESKSAEKYPVVVANIGGAGNIILGTNENSSNIKLKSGAGYLFGFQGKNRTIPHSTYASSTNGFLPAITTQIDGETYPAGSYRISITMRRVMPLELGMPTSPNVISETETPKSSVTEPASKGLPNDKYKYYGAPYEIVRDANGVGVDVVGYRGKTADKQKLLDAYNTNPNIDPQNGKPFKKETEQPKSEQPSTEEKAGKFKFSDGVEIAVPFALNAEQKEALYSLEQFIKNPAKFDNQITLLGYAGTGKTTIIGLFDSYLKKKYITPIYTSPTHRANAVTKQKNPRAKVLTLHSLFGLGPNIKLDEGDYDIRDLEFASKNKPKLMGGQTVIVDESSMVSAALYDFLENFKKNLGIKIIYVGDPAQLKPVKDKDISPVFKKGTSIQLTKVERTGDNPILRESTDLRNGKDFSYTTDVRPNGGVEYTNNVDRVTQIIGENFSSSEFEKDKLYFRILSGTNTKASEYNKIVRDLLHDNTTEQLVVGDVLMGYSNFDVDYNTQEPVIVNSGDYQVKTLQKGTKQIRFGKESLSFSGYSVTLENLMNPEDSLKNVFVVDNTESKDKIFKFVDAVSDYNKQGAIAMQNRDMKTAVSMFQAARELESELAFMKGLLDSNNKAKVKKTLDYGYAHTIHKSQGGTYKKVLILDDTIDVFKDPTTRQQLKYVAMSRASEMVYVATSNTLNEQLEPSSESQPVINLSDVTIKGFYNSLTVEQQNKLGPEIELINEFVEIPFETTEEDFINDLKCRL